METKKMQGISVGQALKLDNLKDLILLGGERGLDRSILSVNVMEVPDILPWVKEGQLLLTTAFSIKDDPVAQERLIPQLAKRGLAGLVIKPKRYIDTIPQMMIDAANKYSFPLLEMPEHLSHPLVMETIYGALVNRHTSILRRSIDAHQRLMKVALDSGGIPAICDTLHEISNNPVFIVGMNAKILGKSPSGVPPELEKKLIAKLNKSQGYYSQFMTKEELVMGDRKIGMVKYPIYIAGKWHGTIIIIEVNRLLKEIDYIAMEQASTVAALTLINHFALREIEQKYKNEFLFEWFDGKIFSQSELIQRGNLVGLELRYNFILVVVEIDAYQELWREDAKSKSNITLLKNKLNSIIDRVAGRSCNYHFVGDRGGRFVLLLKVKPDSSYTQNIEFAKKVSVKIADAFEKEAGHLCSVGIGRYRPSIAEIPLSYNEAKKAISASKYLTKKRNVISFDDLGVFRLLCSENLSEARNLIQEIYNPLIRHDQDSNSQFTETLRAYFECNGNISKTAKKLFAHYNTVVYRLEKIQELTGTSLECSDDRFNLQLAIKLGDAMPEEDR